MSNVSAPFSPLGTSVPVTAPSGSGSASTTLPGSGGDTLRVVNTAAVPVSVVFSSTPGGATATATGVIVAGSAAGVQQDISIPNSTTDVAVWGLGGTGTVYLQRGNGL